MPVPPQASTLIPGESPAIGRERSAGGAPWDRSRLGEPVLPRSNRLFLEKVGTEKSIHGGVRHGKKSMVPNICKVKDGIWNTLERV